MTVFAHLHLAVRAVLADGAVAGRVAPRAGFVAPVLPICSTCSPCSLDTPPRHAPDLSRFEEAAAILEYDQGLTRGDAEAAAARLQGCSAAEGLHRATVEVWEASLRRLTASPSPLARRVVETARRFWAAGWPIQAARLGWDADALFGAHPVAPEARVGAMGLVVFLATGSPPPRLLALDDAGAVLVTPTGTKQRFGRFRTDALQAAPIWEWCA